MPQIEIKQRPAMKRNGFSSGRVGSICEWLLRLVDVGFLAILLLAPYFMGGRHPLGQLVFVLISVAIAACWLTRMCLLKERRWIRSPAEILLVLGVLLCLAQLVPWPASVLQWASPQMAELLSGQGSLAGDSATFPAWTQLSTDPMATRGGLVMLIAYGLLFVVTVQRIQTLHDVKRLMRWMACAAVVMALVGVVQYLAGNGKFMWMYEHPYREAGKQVTGSFINRNHFTQFLVLGLGPLLWWMMSTVSLTRGASDRSFRAGGAAGSSPQLRSVLLLIAVGCVLFAGLMSLSRGGALAMALVVLVSSLAFMKASLLGRKHLVAAMGMVLLLGGAFAIHGHDFVTSRLEGLSSGSIDEVDHGAGRRMIWAANWAAICESPLAGTGVGSHREIYRRYIEKWLPIEYTHAESSLLQIVTESGVVGGVLVLLGIGLCASWAIRLYRNRPSNEILACAGAVTAGLVASLFHSVFDFVWHIPACMCMALLLAACLLRLFQLSGKNTEEPVGSVVSKPIAMGALVALAVVGFGMIQDRLQPAMASAHWDAYLQDSKTASGMGRVVDDRTDGDRDDANSKDTLTQSMMAHLAKCLTANPRDARAHMSMANACLLRFDQLQRKSENPMALSQFREAAIASEYHLNEELDLDEWLNRSMGQNRVYLDRARWHVRRALQLCPLQAEGYVYLAEMCFLERGGPEAKAAYIEQALRLRPHDENVVFAAGKEALLVGDGERTLEYWKESYHQSGRHKAELVSFMIGGQVPMPFFLENFEPPLEDWNFLYSIHQQESSLESVRLLAEYFLELSHQEVAKLSGMEASERWMALSELYRLLEDSEQPLVCYQQALRHAPTRLKVRHLLAIELLKAERYAEAEEHLRWILLRQPEHKRTQARLKQAVAAQLDSQLRQASRPGKGKQ